MEGCPRGGSFVRCAVSRPRHPRRRTRPTRARRAFPAALICRCRRVESIATRCRRHRRIAWAARNGATVLTRGATRQHRQVRGVGHCAARGATRQHRRCNDMSLPLRVALGATLRHRRVSGVGHCAEGACGAVVESGWRGNETAHLTNEPPRRARSERSEDHPLDDTVCDAEARRAGPHPASQRPGVRSSPQRSGVRSPPRR